MYSVRCAALDVKG